MKLMGYIIALFFSILPAYGRENSARELCKIYLGSLGNATPANLSVRESQLVSVMDSLKQLDSLLEASEEANQAGQAYTSPAKSRLSVMQEIPGGYRWRFRIGGNGERPPEHWSSEDYRALRQRLGAIMKLREDLLEDPEDEEKSETGEEGAKDPVKIVRSSHDKVHDTQLNAFEITDPEQIKEILKSGRLVHSDDEVLSNQIICGIFGAAFSMVGGGTYFFGEEPQHELNLSILKEAKKDQALTLENHVKLLRRYLLSYSDSEPLIQEHIKRLKLYERDHGKAPFGARPHEYEYKLLRRSTRPTLSDLMDLALLDRDRISEERLDRMERYYYGHPSADEVFTGGEALRRHEDLSPAIARLKQIGKTALAGTLGSMVSFLACGRMGGKVLTSPQLLVRATPSLHPEMKEVSDLVNSAFSPSAAASADRSHQVLWLGSNTLDGRQADVFVDIDRSMRPVKAKLIGVTSRIPFDYLKQDRGPESADAAESSETAGRDLSQMKQNLIRDEPAFTKLFGNALAPVENLFSRAETLGMDSVQLSQFRDALTKVHSMKDLSILDALVTRFENAKRR